MRSHISSCALYFSFLSDYDQMVMQRWIHDIHLKHYANIYQHNDNVSQLVPQRRSGGSVPLQGVLRLPWCGVSGRAGANLKAWTENKK